MNATFNILILQEGMWPSERLLEFLHAKGFGTQLYTRESELGPAVASVRAPILLLNLDTEAQRMKELMLHLLDTSELHGLPAVLVVDELGKYEEIFSKVFAQLEFLSAESSFKEIYGAVKRLVEVTEAGSGTVYGSATDPKSQAKRTTIIEMPVGGAFPDFLFAQLRALGTDENEVGGRDFLRAKGLDELSGLGMLPSDTATLDAVVELFAEMSIRGKSHFTRVNYMSTKLQHAIGLEDSQVANTQSAALLYAAAFPKVSSLLQKAYLPIAGTETGSLAERIRQSAAVAATKTDNYDVAELLDGIADLISYGKIQGTEEFFVSVSSLVAADLVGRMCFQSGAWTPSGVHSMMRKIKADGLSSLHPSIVAYTIKFINETVAEFQYGEHAKRSDGPEPMLKRDQTLVPIVSLQPGMRVAETVLDVKGRPILEAGTALDADLIWRIWQLSAIRMLINPFVVSYK